jgi:ATP-dependent DNA helicase RecG
MPTRAAPVQAAKAPAPGPASAARPPSAPQRALHKLGLVRDIDLALHLPMRYEDETRLVTIASLRDGVAGQVQGTVVDSRIEQRARRQLLVRVDDGSGELLLRLLHFHPGTQKTLAPGTLVRVKGELRAGFFGREMVHPEFRAVQPDTPLPAGLTPVYPSSAQLPQAYLRKCVASALARAPLHELLPEGTVPAGLPSLREAVQFLHQPPPGTDLDALEQRRHPAWQRLKFDELLAQQLAQAQARAERARLRAPALAARPGGLAERLLAALPFTLTGAQRRVVAEIAADLARPQPMHRLLQGDVGSGKTLIGLYACALAAKAGRQALFLAPTELLAEQHLSAARLFLERVGISAGVLTGSLKSGARRALLARLADGRLQVCFGTHALLSPAVQLANPALAVIDEQHRFGVEQRAALLDKGEDLHALLMSATPIPRTLALSLYGDLDVSVLRELPPGRQRIETKLVLRAERGRVLATFAERLAAGEQGFFVAPRIESSELGRGAEELHAELLATPLARFGIELVHGRLASPEREARLERFRRGASRLLVGTTVIEVGLDVPAATLIAIEGAERFGLAQLHQLRGRVGRGQRGQPWCFLIPERFAAPRLRLLESLADGFALAEQDLSERGMGDLFGARQAGENQEGLAGDVQEADGLDAALLLFAREALERDPAAQSRYLAAELRRRSAP